ncbi:hypothetical protein ACM92K_003083 [Cronobacter turicensis]|uniref:hypothetical protein n=1 Tax=unclassified Cronobacter TaxID=2649764 RepID=UPI0013EB5C9C|nr:MULTISPECIES: hypothetical protein [unclassified Cronobacter]ELQ6226368.1 hypothetical protein [Cronobacter turicensis]KAF6596733.1 hypothetical protein G9G39_06610 [Cronobacter sp. EKM101R]KAF6599559.1 hypothetical protein G9G38_06245 [Cronobacter sp. EKM102R]
MLPENYAARSDAEKRLLAVNAALELIKASVAAPNNYEGRDKLAKDIEYTRHHLAELADAIQAALENR